MAVEVEHKNLLGCVELFLTMGVLTGTLLFAGDLILLISVPNLRWEVQAAGLVLLAASLPSAVIGFAIGLSNPSNPSNDPRIDYDIRNNVS